ncbi:hypothetical protein VWJ18_06895 [Escherichia coli O157]|nr:hypothetical protein [Escherichia coli O157]
MLPFARMFKYGNIKPTLPEIKKLDGSQLHVGLLYSTGNMYMRGSGSNYKLGTGDASDVLGGWVHVPYEVDDFWACVSGTLIKTVDNKLYCAGLYMGGYFGASGSYVNWTEVTSLFVGIDVSQIKNIEFTSAGTSGSTLILMLDGRLYGFGMNSRSELGVNNKVVSPILIDTGVSEIGAHKLGGSSFHYIKGGKYYRCGTSVGSNIGSSSLTTFTVLSIPDNVISMQILYDNVQLLCLGSSGYSIYMAGSNDYGGRGVGGSTVYTTFRKIDLTGFGVVPSEILFENAGNGYVNISTDSTGVYTCGGGAGVNGLGRPTNVIPSSQLGVVQFSTGVEQSNISRVYSQSSSSVIYCIVNNELYWAGSNSYFTDQTTNTGTQFSFIKMKDMPSA